MANLHVMMKVYAITHNLAYTFNRANTKGVVTEYYVTDEGLEMLYDFIKSHSLEYCRSNFSFLFVRATEAHHQHPETYPYLNNFRGTSGTKSESYGTKQKAMIVREVRRCKREYHFDSIKEARAQLMIWLTVYPIEEFTLYRIRTQKGVTFKEKIPLIPTRTSNNVGKTEWRTI